MTDDMLRSAHRIARSAIDDNKMAWKRAGRAVLKKLAKDLELPKGSFEIRFCAGGQAVSGDCILHHDSLYVHLSGEDIQSAGYVRRCKSRTDYEGGINVWVSPDYAELLRVARHLLDPSKSVFSALLQV